MSNKEENRELFDEKNITSSYTMLGNSNLYLMNDRLRIAIIGHRNSGAEERAVAFNLAQNVVENDNIVVSGLAEGIDTFAHVGGRHRTIAVVASLSNIYPKHNEKMAKEIINNNGLVISPNEKKEITRESFLERDKLMVDMSDQIWVVGKDKTNEGGLGYTIRYAVSKGKKIEYF